MTEETLHINDALKVIEVDDAEPLVGKLFRRRFNTPDFPKTPRHFVAMAQRPDGNTLPVGYVHYEMWETSALCGGLVIDERGYRTLPTAVRKAIRSSGGIAEMLMAESFEQLPPETMAIWGHVGSDMSEKVCLRVGFERTEDPYVMVAWRQSQLGNDTREAWLARVVALGPF